MPDPPTGHRSRRPVPPKTTPGRSGVGNPNYLHVLVVQYGPGGGGNYPEGSHDRWQWIHDVEGGCAILLGERYKCDGTGG